MAKKPKKEDPDAEGADAPEEGAGDVAAKRKKKRLVIGGAVLALLAAGGGGYAFLGMGSDEDDTKPSARSVAFVDIREMVVNLASEPNQERGRFLKFRVALEVADPKTASEIQPLLPRVEDTFQVFVRELRASDLEGSAGVYRLREELLRRVNIAVHPAKVDAVLFKEVVVQ